MLPSAGILSALELPFPGLRAFETEEALLFFGRETHTEELLLRLAENRFLAVVGSSGCGKSSLVRAGVLPALFRGYLVGATSRWRFAILRPGMAPIDALAAALSREGALGPQAALRETLGATSGGLAEAVRRAGLAPGESLLVLVDQFEEIFRFALDGRDGRAESEVPLFVSLLLHAAESDVPVYVALTMRSDYQGDCAQFPGLSEALNRSQYLVPRLTRDQRREAITRPLELVETEATPRLVNRVLNDVGDDPDQLPVMQHALLQTYRHWRDAGARGDVDLPDYEAVGGIAHALGRHGDEILSGFSEEDRRLAERIFRALTTTERGRVVRRPQELGALRAVVGATGEAARSRVDAVVSVFARREHSLLLLSSPALEPGTVVDITHESLIRKWPTLAEWTRAEARSVEWYGDLARDVVRYRAGDAGLWRDPELSQVRNRHDQEGWNEAWAGQCSRPGDPPFAEVEGFLEASVEEQAKVRRRERAQQRRISLMLSLLLVTLVVAGAAVYLLNRRNESALRDLTAQVSDVQDNYQLAQNESQQLRARQQELELQLATADSGERVRLRSNLEVLQREYTDWQAKATTYQVQLNELQKNQELAQSDHGALLKKLQNLQSLLEEVTAERDDLKSRLDTVATEQQRDAAYWKNRAADAESRLVLQQQAARPQGEAVARPVYMVVPQSSVVHVFAAPFAGRVAIGVRDVHNQLSSHVRLYVWTADRDTSLPGAFLDDEVRADRLMGEFDNPKADCSADGPGGRSCYRLQKNAVVYGRQAAGSFTLGSNRYEILATGWSNEPDSISVALYPAAAP